jgi:hypothetical protein
MRMADPMKAEFIQMAQRCSHEIRELRSTIDRLRPKADAYDHIATLLGLLPRQSQAFGEDLAWRLEKRISELTSNPVEDQSEMAVVTD